MQVATPTQPDRRSAVALLAAELYREHHGRLLGIARANGASHADAHDAVQFAFCAFIEKFDPDDEALPLAWLTLTLKRACWAAYRRQHLDRSAGQETDPGSDQPGFSMANIASDGPATEEAIERAELLVDARDRLMQLKPDQRKALGLLGAGFSYHEIGERCQWTYTKTNRSIAEGRAALRAEAAA